MDPLSVTCSAITLIDAAGKIASTLYKVVQSLRTADSRVVALGKELQNVSGFLDAIDNALRSCRPVANAAQPTLAGGQLTDPTLLEDNLWQQSEQVLMDCKMTLHELEAVFSRIRDEESAGDNGSGRPSIRRKLGWRARTRAAINLNVHGPTLDIFRDKIQKSNVALQTILHTITLSVMMRNSSSQQVITLELHNLKSSIENVFRNASQEWMSANGYLRGRTSDQSAARMARNLTSLAEAAQHFHSTASSAATVRSYCGSNVTQVVGAWERFPLGERDADTTMSLMGAGLSPFRLERVKTFVGQQQKQVYQPKAPSVITETEPIRVYRDTDSIAADDGHLPAHAEDDGYHTDPARNDDKNLDEEDEEDDGYYDDFDDDDDIDCKQQVFEVTEELAREQIKQGHFDAAMTMLNKVLQQEDLSPSSADRRRVRILLVLCHMMTHDWPKAEPLILQLAATSAGATPQAKNGRRRPRRLSPDEQKDTIIVSNLLHALALAHLTKASFDKALAHCRQALLMKKALKRYHCQKPASAVDGENQTANIGSDEDDIAWARDCCTTLGLVATIYEMTGDYIRAEVFRRQVDANQANYVYMHPASDVAFLKGHFALLGMVLGRDGFDYSKYDAQELDASTPSCYSSGDTVAEEHAETTPSSAANDETDSGYEASDNGQGRQQGRQQGDGLLTAHGSIYGSLQRNTSHVSDALRTRREQWVRFERDTGKEVVVALGNDSDSDSSSQSMPDSAICLDDDEDSDGQSRDKRKRNNSTRLRRHLTRLFVRSDNKDNKVNKDAETAVVSQPPRHIKVNVAGKLHRLAQGRATLMRKSRTLLRKRASPPQRDDHNKSDWCAWLAEGTECWCLQCSGDCSSEYPERPDTAWRTSAPQATAGASDDETSTRDLSFTRPRLLRGRYELPEDTVASINPVSHNREQVRAPSTAASDGDTGDENGSAHMWTVSPPSMYDPNTDEETSRRNRRMQILIDSVTATDPATAMPSWDPLYHDTETTTAPSDHTTQLKRRITQTRLQARYYFEDSVADADISPDSAPLTPADDLMLDCLRERRSCPNVSWACTEAEADDCVVNQAPGCRHADVKIEEELYPNYVAACYYPVRIGEIQSVAATFSHPGQQAIRTLQDNFRITDPDGQEHHCLVHQPLWESIERILWSRPDDPRLPPPMLAMVLFRLFQALDFLHTECHLIHADIKMNNIALDLEPDDPLLEAFEQGELDGPTPRKEVDGGRVIYESRVMLLPRTIGKPVLCDLGSVLPDRQEKNTLSVQPDRYRAPEVILQIPWSCEIDIWNAGCLVWDMFEGESLFDARDRDDCRQLGSMTSLLGPPPLEFIAQSPVRSKFFNEKGEFIHPLPPQRSWEDIERNLLRHGLGAKDREKFLELMRKMLQWMPEKRATAAELVNDEWVRKQIKV